MDPRATKLQMHALVRLSHPPEGSSRRSWTVPGNSIFGTSIIMVARAVRTRKERPDVVVAAHESRVRRDLSVLDGEASWRRYADVSLLPRFIAMIAAALNEGKSGNLQRQNATTVTLV